jgi:hypothetical protein
MAMRKKILLYSVLACAVPVLGPATAAAAQTVVPALRSGADVPAGYVTVSESGLSLPTNAEESGRVRCPQGTVVLSGGAYIKSFSVETGMNLSAPLNNQAWGVRVNNFSGASTTFNVYAVCATQPAGYAQLFGSPVSNPAGDQDSGTVSCPAGDVLFGGGAGTGSASVSVGMTSSYPASSTSWKAAVSNFSARGEEFTPYAVCGQALPGYAIVATSASDPAGVQKGIIQDCAGSAVVLGGGNQSSNTASLRIEMKTSQPFPASGADWKSGENNDTAFGTTLTSYAICAT